MHARSIQRWISLAPRALPGPSRARAAAYSTVSPSDSSPAALPEDSDSLRLSKQLSEIVGKRVEQGAAVKEGVVDVVSREGVPRTRGNKRAKRKPFKSMEGESMQPVPAKRTDTASETSGGVLLDAGLCLDASFKPLKDVNKWRRDRVPKLAHGLEKVLSRQGVHWLRDPETDEYNFSRTLEKIPQPDQFAFDRLPGFVPSSQDEALIAYARKNKCKYIGSTSSLTGILAQIYLLLSEEKLVNLENLSEDFATAPRFFTPGQRIPISVILRYRDGVYTTDVDTERDEDRSEIILLPLGTLLEKFLTLSNKTFNKFLKSHTGENHPHLKDVHRYAKHGKFLMRSQLDCVHDSLPGTGVFDLKTRAISPIRHDVYNYLKYVGQSLTSLTGRYDSFESEYYDMVRAAFLEYSFQARIGNMDGILVAYHNTARIFGFQYVSLDEMDRCLFGREGAGARVFQRCIWLMEMLYRHITRCFPDQSVKATFEKRGKVLRVWVEPVENPNPDAEPPVVELQLSLTNIVHGKPSKGPYAIHTENPWSIKYKLERFDKPQKSILERRQRAYKRQECIGASLPDADQPDLDPEAQAEAAKASVEDEKARAMQELKRDLFEIYYSSRPAQS